MPIANVLTAYDELLDTEFFVQNENLLKPLLDYFEFTWIGALSGRRRRSRNTPLFAVELWNVHDTVLENRQRTNNAMEGWHHRLNSLMSHSRPTVWKFIAKLKSEQALIDVARERVDAGGSQHASKRAYREVSERLQKIVVDYRNRTVIEFLKAIAHNIEVNP